MAALASFVNGHLTDSLPLSDRGLAYGDGLFETIRCFGGQCLLHDYHMQRLITGLNTLGIDVEHELIQQSLQQALQYLEQQACHEAVMKMIVTRGCNQRRVSPGGYGDQAGNATILVQLADAPFALHHTPHTAIAGVCDIRLAVQPALGGLKHLNRLEQVLASREVQARGWDNGILLDTRGHLNSCVNGNLFWVNNGRLYTPEIKNAGIAGTLRRLVIEVLAPARGVVVETVSTTAAILSDAEELFMTSAVVGIQSLNLEGSGTVHGAMAAALREQYLQEVSA